jgi:hypothetical protein
MKMRLLAVVTAAGGIALGLAAAVAPAQAVVRPHVATTTPTITISKTTNLTSGTTVVVKGTGWTPSTSSQTQGVVIGECNSDGVTGTNYASDSCKLLDSLQVSKTGTFQADGIPVVSGALSKNDTAASQCPQTSLQMSHGVQCIIAAANLNTKETAFAPIFFQVLPSSVKVAKAKGRIVNGVQTYRTTISIPNAFHPTASGSTTNFGGFDVIGTHTVNGKTVDGGCQGTTSSSGTTWGIGLPACTGVVGEKVQVFISGKLVRTITTRTLDGVAGGIKHTFGGLTKGNYVFKLVGVTSGVVVQTAMVKVG